MKTISVLSLAAVCTTGYAQDSPLIQSYCADVVESIVTDTVPPTDPVLGHAYTLCVDFENVRYNMKTADGTGLSIFNGTDYWALTADATLPGGWNCTHKASGAESNTFMPYRMTTMDPGYTLNATDTFDGIDGCSNFENFRPGNPPNIPNEYMHWHAAPLAKGASAQQMLATDCIQRSGTDRTGPWMHGMRDYSKNFSPKFVEGELPKDVVCTEGTLGVSFLQGATKGTFAADARFGM